MHNPLNGEQEDEPDNAVDEQQRDLVTFHEKLLTTAEKTVQLYFPGLDLRAFNQVEIAKLTQACFQSDSYTPLDKYASILTAYIQYAYKHPYKTLFDWFRLDDTQDIFTERITPRINRYTTAFAILQNTGFALQNESTYLSLIDMYNAWRLTHLLSDTGSALDKVKILFLPLYDEYHLIMHGHSHPLLFFFRLLMPLVVLCLFVGAIGLLCASLPELVFFVILIPTIIVGILIAAQYITLKNTIYNTVREWWYNGRYHTPEFTELNHRTVNICENRKIAEDVRRYYVKELELCEEREQGFIRMAAMQLDPFDGYPKSIMFNNTDRQATQTRRMTLWGEWLLIREGTKNDANGANAKKVIAHRIKKDINAQYAGLKDISLYAIGAEAELKHAINDYTYTPRLFGNPCPFNQRASLDDAERLYETVKEWKV